MPWWNSKPKEEPTEEPKEEPQATPENQFVTREHFDSAFRSLGEMLRGSTQEVPREEPPKEEPPPDFGDVSDDDIDKAWMQAEESGEARDYATARALERKQSEARLKRLQFDNDRKFKVLEEQGRASVGSLQFDNAFSALKTEKHFERFKDEIEQSLKAIDPMALTPQVAKQVYNLILGNHVDELTQAEAERLVRSETPDAPDANSTRTTRSMNQDRGNEVTPETVFGTTYLDPNARWAGGGTLWGGRGRRDLNDLAQTLGYSDAQEYAELGNAMTQVEDCPECAMPMTEPFETGQPHKCPSHIATHTSHQQHRMLRG